MLTFRTECWGQGDGSCRAHRGVRRPKPNTRMQRKHKLMLLLVALCIVDESNYCWMGINYNKIRVAGWE